MYVQCTKKLLDKLGCQYEKLADPPQASLCWHASYFEHRGESYIVLVQDQSEAVYSFVINSFQDFTKMVKDVLTEAMKEDRLTSEEIAVYWEKALPMLIGPTGDLSLVGRLSGHTRRLKEEQGRKSLFAGQDAIDSLAIDGVFERLFDKLAAFMDESKPKPKKKAGSHRIFLPMQPAMVALNADMVLGGEKKVTRSFLVPLALDFLTLGEILQIGFGWKEDSSHEFSLKSDTIRIGSSISDMKFRLMWEGEHAQILLEDEALLSDYIPGIRRIKYVYGFDRGWRLDLKVGKVSNFEGAPYVECTGGEGTTPPEDCGGPPGYDEMCEILEDRNHEEYAETRVWMRSNRDAAFDQERINAKFKKLKFVEGTR